MSRIGRWLIPAVLAALHIPVGGPRVWAQDEAEPSAKSTYVEPSPLLYEPKTPEEKFAAVLMMVDLARLDLANRYLKQLLETEPDDDLLIKLRDKHGTGEFLKLSRIKELKHQAQGLLEQLSAASRRQAEDPGYAKVLLEKLAGEPVQRELAVREFRNLGESAVPHLLKKLAQPDSDSQTDQIVLTLGRIGQPAVLPIIAGLDSPNNDVRLGAIAALKLLRSPVALPYLWHPAFSDQEGPEIRVSSREAMNRILQATGRTQPRPSPQQAALEVRKLAHALYFQQYGMPLEDDGTVFVWTWDDEAETVVKKSMPSERAQLYYANRFARQALDLAPEHPEPQRLYLACQLGWMVGEQGRDKPVSLEPDTPGYVALTAGEATVSDVLGEALAAGQVGTAQAALQILGQIGTQASTLNGRGRKSPVISALSYPDLRVQFAAANTVLRLEPNKSFRGADRVVAILNRAITNSDETKALIVDADTQRAELTSGFLSELGYQPVQVRTGKEAFEVASTTAGIEVAVLHINCIQWNLTQTVANLRADARTAYLPIVFYGPEDITDIDTRSGRRDALAFPEAGSPIWNGTLPPAGGKGPISATTRFKLRHLLVHSGPATFIAESGSGSDFVEQVRPFISSVSGGQLSGEERGQYQQIAARWLAHLAQADKSDIFDLASSESALGELTENPDLAPLAVAALSGIRLPSIQSRLLAVVTNPQHESALRASAGNQLAFHIQRHGVMLSADQVLAVNAAWKNEADGLIASALAAVIGSLQPEPKVVGERIGKLPAPR